ncbi:xyloglucan galactosyltransferase KATAMARI1 homolog [Phragmites australis]|uniref:xyloglucan galactosyltransferase KATAMARI1 homolog n=1 Tax=Phragmites australis TaxID=29695 RepID=UPI002D779E82|nr:xyloglucan galactosyltransferase KATAMARI1 homolog [Phragmites australis]
MDAADKNDGGGGGGGGGVLRPSRICYLAILSTAFWALVFYLHTCMQGGNGVASVLFNPSAFSLPLLSSTIAGGRPPPEQVPASAVAAAQENGSVTAPSADDRCAGRYVYMYDLPPRFNDEIVRDCSKLDPGTDMCPYVVNCGMGKALGDEGGVFSGRGWYDTHQFMLDVIFHGRMKAYECLTDDSSLANAVFVPFYASLDGGRHIISWSGTSTRDALALDLVQWLARRPEWRTMGGRDHFFVAGRTTWDFRRYTDADNEWGTKLLNLPAVQNMTALVLEISPWSRSNFAVPYPTYFHPETAASVLAWQEKVRKAERRWLFSFAGAPRPGFNHTVRAEIIQQCGASSRCRLYSCGGASGGANCSSPGGVMRLFESSNFCLQPRGDSLTRRSTFDTILAGCIPVFFHPGSAYTQYTLHLPKDPKKYSALIMHTDITGRNVSIEETLSKIPPEVVQAMREEVIALIPRVVYADPRSRRVDFKDAFDVAVEGVLDRVAERRRGTVNGREQ